MQWIVDRFVGDIAVCERDDGFFEEFTRHALPADCREGSVLRKNSIGLFELDHVEEHLRRAKLFALQDDLFK